MGRRIVVVGGGWAGLAAAVTLSRSGHDITLFEAARTLGGRARSLELELPDGRTVLADNGQHILIGAYVETLGLMQGIGLDPAALLQRLPLALRFPDGSGLAAPAWPAPWDAVAGILTAKGWRWADKFSLIAVSLRWQRTRFACASGATVADVCRGITPRVMAEMIEPLCVSALNTPADRASGEVFLRVMRDALFGRGFSRWGGSNLLLPRVDLGALFPQRAGEWLAAHGARVVTGRRVQAISRVESGWAVDGEPFDGVVLACPPWEAWRLVSTSGAVAPAWLAAAASLEYEAITTVYATSELTLPAQMLALRSAANAPAQFVFDRGQLGGPRGLLAFVVSASPSDRQQLQAQVAAQAASLGWAVQPIQTVVEKRATFACTPGLRRPPVRIAAGLVACGDYVEGPYPATIEGAVRSALAAADALI